MTTIATQAAGLAGARAGTSPSNITSAGAPLRIGAVALTVRDLDRVSRFYQEVAGLRPIELSADRHQLGAGERVLLDLRHDPAAVLADRREAGLFHTAFLLPRRSDLADWVRHAADTGVRIQGASDHLVSEALYLDDPEGNGIEIYWDRPSESWGWDEKGFVEMATRRLDLPGLAREETGRPFAGLPDGTIVGHVHLQVGDLDAAERFYAGLVGFEVTTHYPGATFLGAGRYHHHIGTNVWNSRGAGPRTAGRTGLAEVGLVATPELLASIAPRLGAAASERGFVAQDPWGTSLRFSAA
ncbi:VOC family protein [Aureimonas mangrovi]|uniref:VOC family protein n=1 Tax=Aureimonas mangrovi TaxID=2758041 RepID=UPI00163D79D6|nr:VOC family protein [Aureimonas mangrovi]